VVFVTVELGVPDGVGDLLDLPRNPNWVDDVGPLLRNASAKANKVARFGSGDGGGFGGSQRGFGASRSDRQRRGRSVDIGQSGGFSDEPPFLRAPPPDSP
jgi:hypothetical protein